MIYCKGKIIIWFIKVSASGLTIFIEPGQITNKSEELEKKKRTNLETWYCK